MLFETHTTDKAMMERKTRHEVQESFVVEHDTDGSIEFITGEQLEIWHRDKIKGTVKPEKQSLTKRYKKRFIKYVKV